MVHHSPHWCCTVAENNISIRSWRSWTGGSLLPKTVAAAQNERTIEGPIDWPMIGNCGAGEELDVKTGEEFTSTSCPCDVTIFLKTLLPLCAHAFLFVFARFFFGGHTNIHWKVSNADSASFAWSPLSTLARARLQIHLVSTAFEDCTSHQPFKVWH